MSHIYTHVVNSNVHSVKAYNTPTPSVCSIIVVPNKAGTYKVCLSTVLQPD